MKRSIFQFCTEWQSGIKALLCQNLCKVRWRIKASPKKKWRRTAGNSLTCDVSCDQQQNWKGFSFISKQAKPQLYQIYVCTVHCACYLFSATLFLLCRTMTSPGVSLSLIIHQVATPLRCQHQPKSLSQSALSLCQWASTVQNQCRRVLEESTTRVYGIPKLLPWIDQNSHLMLDKQHFLFKEDYIDALSNSCSIQYSGRRDCPKTGKVRFQGTHNTY